MNAQPLCGVRKAGKILARDTFPKTLSKVFKRHPREREPVRMSNDDSPSEEEEEREVYVFSVDDQRRIAFRKRLDDLGIPYDEISTHSYRKGAASYTASGSTAAPPIIAICLRAGWKLGGVLNTYLSLENAGDRFVGRRSSHAPHFLSNATRSFRTNIR